MVAEIESKVRSAALVLFTVLAASSNHATPPPRGTGTSLSTLFPGATFDPKTPTQEKLLGVPPGQRALRPEELLSYFEALASSSSRAKVIPYAKSHEGRPLIVLAVSDEETISRLDAFRAEHARRMDPRGREPGQDRQQVENAKAVAWMAYAIHGDELSSSDAAAALAYWLVAGEDERARALRRDLLVLIDPSENPDGRARFLALTASFAHSTPSPDPEDLSHATVWPQGRGNHYLFDLNRDWFSLVQPESRRSTVIASWNPQLVVDSHEMGSDDTYLFSPPRHPFDPLRPAYEREWHGRFAADQARALDARGYAYYTREWNEEFFPGYGSSWASHLGAIGILYEMSGTDGTLVRQRKGTLRTYGEAVEHQVTSSVANLETLAKHRIELLKGFVDARREAIRSGASGSVGAWIFPPGRYPDRSAALAELLRAQGVDVLRAASVVRTEGLHDARTGEVKGASLPAGTWMVPLDQPAGLLARAVLDPHVPMEKEFLMEEREYLERGRGTRLYETTAWSLPIAYGIDAYWCGTKPPGDWRAEAPEPEAGSVSGDANTLAFIFDGTSDRAAFALADLLQRGIAVRLAEKPFRIEGRAFPEGSILIPREGNPTDLIAKLREVAERWRIPVASSTTAKAEEGPDLGGAYFHPLVAPRIGVWTGPPVSSASYGSIWHMLDSEMDLRFAAVSIGRFGSVDLDRYNVLVFPPGGGYESILGKNGLERLRRWIEAGGTAIGIGSGAAFLADREFALTKTRLRREALDRYPPVVMGVGAQEAEAAGPFRAAGVAAPDEKDEKEVSPGSESAKKKAAPPPRPKGVSPYDVAPVLGPGARPFVRGFDQGTPVGESITDLSTWLKPVLPAGREKPEQKDLERADERLRRFAPQGVFLRVELDPERWLGWGLPRELDAFVDEDDTLVAEPPVEVVARFAEIGRLHLSGLLWPEAAARLARTAYATREGLGKGQVILFTDEPGFRGWTLGTRRLLINALLYGPGLGTEWSSPW